MVANEGVQDQNLPARRRSRAPWFAIRLKERMDEIGLSRVELARKAKISPQQLSYYVRGDREPSLMVAKRIASILEVPLDDLIDSRSVFSHRDNKTYMALERFYHLTGDLEPDDVSMLVDVAEFAAIRRRDESKRYMGMVDSPACELLVRVHHVVIPAIFAESWKS